MVPIPYTFTFRNGTLVERDYGWTPVNGRATIRVGKDERALNASKTFDVDFVTLAVQYDLGS